MPRFFFHLHTESGIEPDFLGSEFSTLEEAVSDAQQARNEYMRDEGIEEARLRRRCRFEITDESRRFVATVPIPDQ